MAKHGKRYQEAKKAIGENQTYGPQEAMEILVQNSKVKFDETVELHLRTNADPRHADQLVRGVAMLPNGLGKPVRVLVFATPDVAHIAKEAGADFVGDDDIIKNIEDGWTGFDVGLAIPEMMTKIGRLGRILGRKGLMPNPRTGTMIQSQDLPRAINEAKQGRVEFRMDRTAIIHASIGKVGQSSTHLMENLTALIDSVIKSRPPGVKGTFVKSSYLTSTMGPSINLDINALLSLKIE